MRTKSYMNTRTWSKYIIDFVLWQNVYGSAAGFPNGYEYVCVFTLRGSDQNTLLIRSLTQRKEQTRNSKKTCQLSW